MLPLTCTAERLDGKLILRVLGEVDTSNEEILRQHLIEIARFDGHILIDLRELSYIGSTGIDVLVRAAEQREPKTITLIVRDVTHRLFASVGLDETFEFQEDPSSG